MIPVGPKIKLLLPFGACEVWNAENLYGEGKFHTPFLNSEMDYLCGSIKNVRDSGNPDWFYDYLCCTSSQTMLDIMLDIVIRGTLHVWVPHMRKTREYTEYQSNLFSQPLVMDSIKEKEI